MIFLEDFKKKINIKFEKGALPSKVLQSFFKIGFDKPVSLFGDPTYLPFYYYVGKIMKGSKNLIEFGFDLGMASGCFMKGSESVNNFVAFRKKSDQYFAKRLGISNVHNILKKKFDLWIGDEADPEFLKIVLLHKWDCAIINDPGQCEKTCRAYLDLVWSQMIHGGLIIVDFLSETPIKNAYTSFCKSQNRDMFTISTLRGTGILQK